MRHLVPSILVCAVLTPAFSQSARSPFAGRWNFNIDTPAGPRASWLGITERDGSLEVWYQPTGGNVFQLKEVRVEGNRLVLGLSGASGKRPALTWELEPKGSQLAGVQRRGDTTTPLTGTRAPELKRSEPKAWSSPVAIFNGKDLTGWEPIGDPKNSRWTVKDGLLVNEDRGANLKSTEKYQDFKLHFEVNYPADANSGMYLRGRYEIQLESHGSAGSNPPERGMASIYGRIAPEKQLPLKPGQWETFDVTLVGRTLTVVRNGVTIINKRELEGITGGALDANEAEPGPFYIQGDHTGGLKFRNITVALPKR